jgi:hypothetical protein
MATMPINQILWYAIFITLLGLVILVGLSAPTSLGQGVAIMFGGIMLAALGLNYIIGLPAIRESQKLRRAIAAARERSRLWWLPFAGLAVSFGGMVLVLWSERASSLEEILSIFLVMGFYSYTVSMLANAPRLESAAAS